MVRAECPYSGVVRFATARKLSETNADDSRLNQTRNFRLVANPARSDYALAQNAARGGMPALGILYERHNRYVYAVCLSMTRNPAEAEDLTQDVFVHLVRKIGSFRGESRFTTWLHRLTVNVVLMHFRRRDIFQEQARDDREWTYPETGNFRPPSSSQLTDRLALASALAQLPRGARAVLVLFDIVGLHHHEIADLLGCSAGTSKSQLHRARMKLRRLLKANVSR
jgi:RNA polymerase sigma-70 factor, ECF subfamily